MLKLVWLNDSHGNNHFQFLIAYYQKQKSYSRGILELIVLGTQKLCNPGSMQYWRDILEVRLRELFKELLIQEKQLHQYEQQH